MKNLPLTLLVLVWLQLLSFNLSAKKTEGRFTLKEGDWFEVQVNSPLSITNKEDLWAKFFNSVSKHELSYQLRYDFQKQLANGNQVFQVSIKRIQSKMYNSHFGVWMGYDSYYPNYQDNKKKKEHFIEFEMEVLPNGNIERFDSISGTPPILGFDEINPRRNTTIGVVSNMVFPKELVLLSSSLITFLPAKSGIRNIELIGVNDKVKVETNGYSETPLYDVYKISINDSLPSEMKLSKNHRIDLGMLSAASFPIPANTIIKGNLPNEANKDITISLDGDYDELYFQNMHFKTDSKGSFNCPIFLNAPLLLNIQVGNQNISSFIESNDTLEILEIQQPVERNLGTTILPTQIKPGYMINATNFAGNGANNARFSTEMLEWVKYIPMSRDVQEYTNYHEELIKNTNELINQYSDKVSETCINYFRSRRNYFLADVKLKFYEENQLTTIQFNENEKNFDYPADFFSEVDTLSTIMHPFPWCYYYRTFNEYAKNYKQNRLGMSVGGMDKDFYGNYYFTRASLKGWALYTNLYKNLDTELRKGSEAAKRIDSYYQDFMNNCNDPSLTEPLSKIRETLDGLAIGKTFPIKSFVLTDNTVFDLEKHKGKPICLAFIEFSTGRINEFKREIDNFKPNEVEFIFICLPNNYIDQRRVDSSLLAMPNVHLIEVSDKDLKDKILLSKFCKIYMLDKWLRITDDNMLDPNSHYGDNGFKEAIEKAIKTKRFSKAEKTAMIKTAGWSLGSILFTFLIGLWVYKIRVRKLKQQEAAKRRIKELEIKAVRSQMNPHFIFNALNSIQSLINGSHFKEANIYLSKFAVLLRGVLHNSEKVTVTLSDELQAVELYCQLEQLRFEFKFEMNIDPQVNADIIEIPGMIIQPLVENAIVHGLSPKGSDGRLTIGVERQNGNLCVCVTDNGVGIILKEADVLSQKGFGLKLVEERINILNLDGKEAKLRVENRNDATGTLATLIIPID